MSYPPRKPRKHATPAEAREARSKALEPYKFQPGQSGNPAGFPKGRREQIEACERLARERSPEAIEVMTELMRYSEDDRVRLVAAEKIGERGLGKAREFVPDEDASTRHDVTAKQLREQLIKLIENDSEIEVPPGFVPAPDDDARHAAVWCVLVMFANQVHMTDDGRLIDMKLFRDSVNAKRRRWDLPAVGDGASSAVVAVEMHPGSQSGRASFPRDSC